MQHTTHTQTNTNVPFSHCTAHVKYLCARWNVPEPAAGANQTRSSFGRSEDSDTTSCQAKEEEGELWWERGGVCRWEDLWMYCTGRKKKKKKRVLLACLSVSAWCYAWRVEWTLWKKCAFVQWGDVCGTWALTPGCILWDWAVGWCLWQLQTQSGCSQCPWHKWSESRWSCRCLGLSPQTSWGWTPAPPVHPSGDLKYEDKGKLKWSQHLHDKSSAHIHPAVVSQELICQFSCENYIERGCHANQNRHILPSNSGK